MAQAADLMAPLHRAKPLHVVADSRGPLLHEFVERLHVLRARTSDPQRQRVLLTTDILPTEDLTAGVPTDSALQGPPSIFSIRACIMNYVQHATWWRCLESAQQI